MVTWINSIGIRNIDWCKNSQTRNQNKAGKNKTQTIEDIE